MLKGMPEGLKYLRIQNSNQLKDFVVSDIHLYIYFFYCKIFLFSNVFFICPDETEWWLTTYQYANFC